MRNAQIPQNALRMISHLHLWLHHRVTCMFAIWCISDRKLLEILVHVPLQYMHLAHTHLYLMCTCFLKKKPVLHEDSLKDCTVHHTPSVEWYRRKSFAAKLIRCHVPHPTPSGSSCSSLQGPLPALCSCSASGLKPFGFCELSKVRPGETLEATALRKN